VMGMGGCLSPGLGSSQLTGGPENSVIITRFFQGQSKPAKLLDSHWNLWQYPSKRQQRADNTNRAASANLEQSRKRNKAIEETCIISGSNMFLSLK
jgi:hypothetical protein